MQYVRRYTTLSNLLYSLNKRKLVLLNPVTWDDKNDVHFLEFYRRSCNIESIFAMCCTLAEETYHHWKVFAPGIEGVCIEFALDKLEFSLKNQIDIDFKRVAYKKISIVEGYNNSSVGELPFLKRDRVQR